MNISKDDVKDITIATVKGVVSSIPGIGGLFAEYIGLAQSKIADNRMSQWMEMVEDKLRKLQDKFDDLTSDELFYSALQITTQNAMRAYQKEKRILFANALYNTVQFDLDADKKLLFLSLLDRYTLSGIKLLQYYSENHYTEERPAYRGGTVVYTIGGTEYPMTSILENNPEWKNDSEYVKTLSEQLINDGLVSSIDFRIPENPKQARRKRTTKLGDEFLSFIAAD